jgi:hypothetical protein
MKKIVPIIIVILFIALIVLLAIKGFNGSNNTSNNTPSNIVNTDVITINETRENNAFVYNKIEINESNKTLKLYYSAKEDDISNYVSTLRIYSDDDVLLETLYILNYGNKEDVISLNYKNDLSKASHYAIDLDVGPSVDLN